MHFFGLLGSLMFIFGFIAVVIVGATKLYHIHSGMPYRLVTDSPYFYLSLTAMIIGTQLFLAGLSYYQYRFFLFGRRRLLNECTPDDAMLSL